MLPVSFRIHSFAASVAALCLIQSVAATGVSAHGTYHELVTAATEKIAVHPAQADLYVERSRLHLEHEDWQAALVDLEYADRLAPTAHLTEIIRAQALMMGGQWEAAGPVLDGFLKLRPLHSAALLERARILNHLEQMESALTAYRLALKQAQNAEPDLYQEVAVALEKGGQSEEAILVLDQGVSKFGAVSSLATKAMELEAAHGHLDAALARVDLMQASAPRPEPWMARRASLLAQSGRLDESQAAWQVLASHIAALPSVERGSHAMSLLAEQALTAVAALQSLKPLEASNERAVSAAASPLSPTPSAAQSLIPTPPQNP